MKILITCAGRRDELVSYFQKEGIEVHVSDKDKNAPALQVSDKTHIVPNIFSSNYIDTILQICITNKINLIFSLNDLELQLLADNKQIFLSNNIFPLISDSEVISTCCDKIKMNNFLRDNNFSIPENYEYGQICAETLFPIIIKPRYGTASIGVDIANNFLDYCIIYPYLNLKVKQSQLNLLPNGTDLLIQEKVEGLEYAVDIINDFEGKYLGSVIKRKIETRNGDASLVISEKNDFLEKECKRLSETLRHIGNMDVDVIVNEKGIYFVDLNPRFGGAYPFSYHIGVNLPKMIKGWFKNKNSDDFGTHYETGILAVRTEKYFKISNK
jgi:carbamoyl-phosphate synthase large subunit